MSSTPPPHPSKYGFLKQFFPLSFQMYPDVFHDVPKGQKGKKGSKTVNKETKKLKTENYGLWGQPPVPPFGKSFTLNTQKKEKIYLYDLVHKV